MQITRKNMTQPSQRVKGWQDREDEWQRWVMMRRDEGERTSEAAKKKDDK